MTQGTRGTRAFRVLPGRSDDEWVLLDVESAEPTSVPRSELPNVEVGNRVSARVSWDVGEAPREVGTVGADGDEGVTVESAAVDSPTVESETVFRFVRTGEPVFEAARTCFKNARAEAEAMNSRVTYNTDSDPNGVVYTFAEAPGGDRFAEFRDGRRPLEPLVERAAKSDTADPPFSVWVLDSGEPFVLVYIVLDPDGLLEETMRDTYL